MKKAIAMACDAVQYKQIEPKLNGLCINSVSRLQFDNLYYIDLCNDGTPKHPLYLKSDLELKKYSLYPMVKL